MRVARPRRSRRSIRGVALREAVDAVRRRWAAASGWLAIRERTTVVAGSDARGTARRLSATLVLRASDGAHRVLERAGDDASPAAIVALGVELAALGPGGGRGLDPGHAENHDGEQVVRDPAVIATRDWLAELDETLRRTEALGSSRIVWRAAHAVIDDERSWFVGDGRDVAQRAVRVQSGVSTVVWSGTRPMIGEVVIARAAGLEALALDDDQVARATGRALESFDALGEPPAGVTAVVLDPSVTAALLGAGIGDVLTTGRWARPLTCARVGWWGARSRPPGSPSSTIRPRAATAATRSTTRAGRRGAPRWSTAACSPPRSPIRPVPRAAACRAPATVGGVTATARCRRARAIPRIPRRHARRRRAARRRRRRPAR